MKDLWIVASYTIKDMLKKKTFLVSNLVILLIIIIGFNIPNIMNAITSTSGEGGEAVEITTQELIVDAQNIFEGTLEKLNTNESHIFLIENKEVSKEEYEMAYRVANKIIEKGKNKKYLDELTKFTTKYLKILRGDKDVL